MVGCSVAMVGCIFLTFVILWWMLPIIFFGNEIFCFFNKRREHVAWPLLRLFGVTKLFIGVLCFRSLATRCLACFPLPGKHEVIDTLIKHDADLNACDYHGSTPLHLAAQAGSQSVIVSCGQRLWWPEILRIVKVDDFFWTFGLRSPWFSGFSTSSRLIIIIFFRGDYFLELFLPFHLSINFPKENICVILRLMQGFLTWANGLLRGSSLWFW